MSVTARGMAHGLPYVLADPMTDSLQLRIAGKDMGRLYYCTDGRWRRSREVQLGTGWESPTAAAENLCRQLESTARVGAQIEMEQRQSREADAEWDAVLRETKRQMKRGAA